MLIACWSSKGGSGTTVVASGLALVLAKSSSVVLADLAGDVPAVLGIAETPGLSGLRDWLSAGSDVPADRLASLEMEAAPNLRVLAMGSGDSPSRAADQSRAAELAVALASDPRPVVVDCGLLATPEAVAVAAAAPVGFLVLRPCYLALRRALSMPVRPTGVILVRERDRALARRDVEDVLGVEVRAQVEVDPSIARAVDAGLLARRLPTTLEHGLRGAA